MSMLQICMPNVLSVMTGCATTITVLYDHGDILVEQSGCYYNAVQLMSKFL